jgi:hypothetical protein
VPPICVRLSHAVFAESSSGVHKHTLLDTHKFLSLVKRYWIITTWFVEPDLEQTWAVLE